MRFVFGLPSQAQLTPAPPVNGEPYHLDAPPESAVGSGLSHKQRFFIVVGAVAILFILLIVIFINVVIDFGDSPDPVPDVVTDVEQPVVPDPDPIEDLTPPVEDNSASDIVLLSDKQQSLGDMQMASIGATSGIKSGATFDSYARYITIKIDSEPAGAIILNADGSVRGKTPYEGKDVKRDKKEKLTLQFSPKETLEFEIDYAKDVKQKLAKAASAAAPKKSKKPRKPRKRRHKRRKKPKDNTNDLLF